MRLHLRRLPLIYQSTNAECALACVAMLCGYHGRAIDLDSLRRLSDASLRGTTLTELIRVARTQGLASRVVRVEPAQLGALATPCILHWNLSHFVVLRRVGRKAVWIHDPNHGAEKIALADIGRHLSGIAVEMRPGADFVREDQRRRIGLGDLATDLRGAAAAFATLLALALLAQSLIVAVPYYFQLVVDQAIPSLDVRYAQRLALLFGALILIDWILRHLRMLLTLYLSARVNLAFSQRLFAHLLHLPLAFFEQRNVSDMASKFDSVEEIRAIVTEDAVRLLVDALMLLVTLAILVGYDLRLALCASGFVGFYLALRVSTYHRFRIETEQQLRQKVQERGHLLETVRGIQAVKALSAESTRLDAWRTRFTAGLHGDTAISRRKLSYELMRDGLLALENVASLYLGALLVIRGELSIGMIFAFYTYKRLFTTSAMNFVEVAFKVRVLRLHFERLADILASTPDARDLPASAAPLPFAALRLQGLGFRYGSGQPWLFRGLDLDILPGEHLVITGPSGCGKTTLLRLLIGLNQAQEGQLLLGAADLAAHPRASWTPLLGVVMQDDLLFAGSVADNISFFADAPDAARLAAAAQAACIAEDIEALPMGYETLIGELGSSFSAGQIQRIVLARALYRQPRLLIMDEGTANLDEATERRVLSNLKALGLTVVQAAHRPQPIAMAARVYDLASMTIRVAPRAAAGASRTGQETDIR
jgi:ATP-binding cassette, subfamily B, bacterial CvaB/MchF/RaxB